MKKLFSLLVIGTLLTGTMPITAAEKALTLTAINIAENSVVATFSGRVKYRAFKVATPPRLVIECRDTDYVAKERLFKGQGGMILQVRAGQYKDHPVTIARIVVDLKTMTDYTVEQDETKLTVKMGAANSAPQQKKAKDVSKEPATPVKATTQPVPAVKAESGKATVKPPVAVQKAAAVKPAAAKQEVVKKPKTETVASKSQPVEKSPVGIQPKEPAAAEDAVEVVAVPIEPSSTKPQESPKEAVTPDSHPCAPAVKTVAKQETTGRLVMPKKPVTLDFEEADIRDVLRILSIKSGINIIYGNDVAGTISVRLENVPFDRAFATIMSLKNLVSQEEGANILRVVTPQKIAEERSQAVTFTKIFPLNYAKGDEVKANLDSIRAAEGRRGNVSVDARTNSLIVTDTPEGLASIDKIIAELDTKPQQVVIEAKIVEVTLVNDYDMGIEWSYAQTIPTSGGALTIGQMTDSNGTTYSGAVNTGQTSTVGNAASGGTGVTFPGTGAGGTTGAITFGLVQDNSQLSATITALAQKGLSKTLSNPKVTTINNKKASILIGQRIPYTTTTVSVGGTTQETNFMDVGVKLNVTPTINKDKRITIDVHPEVSLYVRTDTAGPVIGTREAQTTVIVNNGQTIVIGGLISDDDEKAATQVPLLGDIPIIGQFFKHKSSTKERTELLVFITPKIVD